MNRFLQTLSINTTLFLILNFVFFEFFKNLKFSLLKKIFGNIQQIIFLDKIKIINFSQKHFRTEFKTIFIDQLFQFVSFDLVQMKFFFLIFHQDFFFRRSLSYSYYFFGTFETRQILHIKRLLWKGGSAQIQSVSITLPQKRQVQDFPIWLLLLLLRLRISLLRLIVLNFNQLSLHYY